jgi:hypothetical protein
MEPGVDARMIRLYLESIGARLHHQEGSHKLFVMPDGRKVPCIDDGRPVSRNHTSSVGRALGHDRAWLLERLGVQRAKTGKMRKGPVRQQAPKVRRNDVENVVADIHGRLSAIAERVEDITKHTLNGVRSEDCYKRALVDLAEIQRGLTLAERVAS